MVETPDRDGFQVLDWIMSRQVHEYLDVAGRPVGEGRAAAFLQAPTEMQSCPYAGSRHHHAKPMNLTALQRMPPWQQVLTMLSWLSQRYRSAHRTGIATCDDLAQVTSAGVFLADFLVLRQHQPLRRAGGTLAADTKSEIAAKRGKAPKKAKVAKKACPPRKAPRTPHCRK